MKPIKTFLIWILLLALPMQGFAAASMLACSHMSAPVAQAASLDTVPHCQSDAQAGAGDCGVHAECRLAAAIAADFACVLARHPTGSHQIPYVGVYATAYYPDGLERPPHPASSFPN